MIAGGEDPSFIARGMLILASEDIRWLIQSALVIANTASETVESHQLPECWDHPFSGSSLPGHLPKQRLL